MPPDEAGNDLWVLGGNPPPPILYHYTSMQGPLSIVETGRIRATHVRYLNDLSEVETLWSFVLTRLRHRRNSTKSTEANAYLSEIIKLAQTRHSPSVFVASFSEVGDDLSQWRSYCTEGAGFSIGFSSAALGGNGVSDPAGGKPIFVDARLLKIRYLNENDPAGIDAAIDGAFKIGDELHRPMRFRERFPGDQVSLAWSGIIAPSYKNSAFQAEREWRVVLMNLHEPMPRQRFRAGKSTLVPYIEVDLNPVLNQRASDEYMIRKVIVGPTPNPDLSMEALRSLFVSKGHGDVLIEKSVVPYRHW